MSTIPMTTPVVSPCADAFAVSLPVHRVPAAERAVAPFAVRPRTDRRAPQYVHGMWETSVLGAPGVGNVAVIAAARDAQKSAPPRGELC